MKTIFFDIEADGLMMQAKNIWCAVFYNVDTDSTDVFRLAESDGGELANYIYEQETLVRYVGHNIFGYDLKVIRRLCGINYTVGKVDTWNGVPCEFVDTFQLSNFLNPDRVGGHSLDNLSQLAGSYKMGFKGPWDRWSQEMEDYCIQDTKATAKVYEMLLKEAKAKYGSDNE